MAEEKDNQAKPITLKKIKFLVGSEVYLKTDPYQHKRIVTAVHLKPGGYMYELRFSVHDPTLHADIEISEEKDEDIYTKELLHGDRHDDEGLDE